MQRNQYPGFCSECRGGVARDGGALYGAGASNTIVCDSCLFDYYGESKGYLAPLAGQRSRFADLAARAEQGRRGSAPDQPQ